MGAHRQPRPLHALKRSRPRQRGAPLEARALLLGAGPRGFPLGLHAFCKINLGLRVGRLRPDGFHEVDTILQTVDLADTLYARPRGRGFRLRVVRRGPARRSGFAVPAGEANLVLRAARLAARALGEPRGAELLLVKRVPVGGGLGGGSSDAAAALRLLPRLWGRRIPEEERHRLAFSLGSDCVFFLKGGRARATGRGERLAGLPVPPGGRLVLVLPRRGISTARAYRLLDRARAEGTAGATQGRRRDGRSDRMREGSNDLTLRNAINKIRPRADRLAGPEGSSLPRNELEEVIARHYPEVKKALHLLSERGVAEPRMSGSGSAVFGLLSPGGKRRGVVTRLRPRSFDVMLARFTRVGSLWCR